VQDGSESSTTEPAVVIEFLSSTNAQNLESQAGKEALGTDQSKQGNPYHQFMEIKKKGVKIKQDIYPQICDQGSSQTKLLSALDYEKGKLNIVVLESKDQNIKSSDNYKLLISQLI
jgi:hypothetical protein